MTLNITKTTTNNPEVKTPRQEREEEERNNKIVSLYKSGEGRYSYTSLARMFKITPARIGQIIKRAEKRRQFKNVR